MFKKTLIKLLLLPLVLLVLNAEALPEVYDLRNVNSVSYLSMVRSQQGGTCWAHGSMAAIESNMLINGLWPLNELYNLNLSEYHLDWWNGFNLYFNEDFGFDPEEGLEVHMGGDYRVTTAYLSRGDGAVLHLDAPSFENADPRREDYYTYYYPRHVEWFSLNEDMSNMDVLKRTIMDYGAVGTCMYVGTGLLNDTTGIHYQEALDYNDPNHSIAIVGWNDTLSTQADLPGAWLCKNSWGESWGSNWQGYGYFWISYYDKHAARQDEMGFVSFKEVEPMRYDTVYYHDYHGWRDQLEDIQEAANIFEARGNDTLVAVNFFTAEDSVNYTLKIFMGMSQLHAGLASHSQNGFFAHKGFHTVDLTNKITLIEQDTFIVSLSFDKGAYPYDKSSEVPVLLGVPSIYAMNLVTPIVPSKADFNESLLKISGQWIDLQYIDESANFCIKALVNCDKSISALSNVSEKSSFSLYPNPSHQRINVNFNLPVSADVKISLYNLMGRRVSILEKKSYPMGYNMDNFSLSGLPNGIYLCIFEQDGVAVHKQKIVVMK